MSDPNRMTGQPEASEPSPARVPLAAIVREWGRIGCIGFGGPPTHIKLLRDLCVQRRGWLDAREFEDAIAVCNLLPGPASTQLAIFCAWRLRPGRRDTRLRRGVHAVLRVRPAGGAPFRSDSR
jgi:hypothetical protein